MVADPPEARCAKARRLAKVWGISDDTTKRWIDLGYPVDDEIALAKRLTQDNRSHVHTRRRALEVLAGQKSPEQQDREVREAEVKTHKTALGIAEYLESQVARYQHDQARSQSLGDVGGVEHCVKQLVVVGKALIGIRKELRKMGEEAGQSVSRDEVRQIVAAFGSRASLGLSRLTERLSKEIGEEFGAKVGSIATAELYFEPFTKAQSLAAASGLPAWVVEAMQQAVADHVEVDG